MGSAGPLRKSDAGVATGQIDRPLLPVGAGEVLLPVIDLGWVLAPARGIDTANGAGPGVTGGFQMGDAEPDIDQTHFAIARLERNLRAPRHDCRPRELAGRKGEQRQAKQKSDHRLNPLWRPCKTVGPASDGRKSTSETQRVIPEFSAIVA